ncbi:hypothetical protein QBC34DRAFT_429183 [Podospora aff. communis PSN243]|uniref:Chitin-binding type-1 domain-containing protein n=1 Tax=Podospora aff. communis PSN243 TaxID=3040156 RepID=A0AAV9GAT7_9PEZI|nr:hypothetical protein QBC34DRAFT_429183 [Podospora aff. communis PSN243]
MKFQLITILSAISAVTALNAPTAGVLAARSALTEYNRITTLAETARRNYDAQSPDNASSPVEPRCDRLNDPCCPDGTDGCVEDFCKFGDGINYGACLLGCCNACGNKSNYCKW